MPEDSSPQGGVPLGGIGAGCVEMGMDGRFRNITINNNRVPTERIGLSAFSFVALRVKVGQQVYTRVLQRAEGGDLGPGGSGTPCLSKQNYAWRGLYPASDYRLVDRDCAADLLWSAFAPVVPFDYDASTLPAFFLGAHVRNPTDETLEVSVVFNWENLCGRTRDNIPAEIAPVFPEYVEVERDTPVMRTEDELEEAAPPTPNALIFGPASRLSSNADGQYCLAAKTRDGLDISVFAWDHENTEDQRSFWEGFRYEGNLAGLRSASESSRSGAVCCAFQLPPGGQRRVDFVLSWYCPRFSVGQKNHGNGYTNRFSDSLEVARNGLEHVSYYFSAVKEWHRRVQSSSLPKWLNEMLINSSYVFSTNTVHTKSGLFGMMESPSNGKVCDWASRLYSSLGTLLFFPRLEKDELSLSCQARNDKVPEQLCQHLGVLALEGGAFDGSEDCQVNLWSQLVLASYRNYIFTGESVPAQEVFPRLRSSVVAILARDVDRDGLPEVGTDTAYNGIRVRGLTSYTAGLWVVALRAYGSLAKHLGHIEEAKRFELVHRRASESFETWYWDGELGYYRFYFQPDSGSHVAMVDGNACGEDAGMPSHRACNVGQLAGQWYADFLGFGDLFQRAHMTRAMKMILRYNATDSGMSDLCMPSVAGVPNSESIRAGAEAVEESTFGWPGFSAGHFAALLIGRGLVREGFSILERQWNSIHRYRRKAFDQPKLWNIAENDTVGGSLERHCSGLSVWYSLYAVQGFLLDVAAEYLRVMPNLSEDMEQLRAPLFTPNCFGMLTFRETRNGLYRQHLTVSFDSPVSIKVIELRVPLEVNSISVQCVTSTGAVTTECSLQTESHYQRLIVTPRHAITTSGEFVFEISEDVVEEAPAPRKGWWR